MFDDIGEEELDVHTEASDEPLDETELEDDQKKPGPLQVCTTVSRFCDGVSAMCVSLCGLGLLQGSAKDRPG